MRKGSLSGQLNKPPRVTRLLNCILNRQRYWYEIESCSESARLMFYRLRSYLGYPPVRDALPNTSHYAIAALQYASYLPRLVTQNVDGLHHKAIAHLWEPERIQKQILELHGTLHVRSWAVLHSLSGVSANNKPIILLAASTLHARSYSSQRHISRLAFCF